MFRHVLIDEMQDTNTRPGRARRDDRPRRGGQPDGRRRRRPVDLPVPRGQLRQHPQVPRAPPRRRGSSGSRSTTARRPRSSPSPTPRSRTTRSGFPKTLVSARPAGRPAGGRPDGRRLRGGRLPLPADPRGARAGRRRSAGWRSSTATTTTASCSRASWSRAGSPTRSGAGCGSSSRPTSRTCWPTCGSWSTRATRRPGGGCCCSCRGSARRRRRRSASRSAGAADPLGRAGDGRDDGRSSPPRARGSSPASSPTSGKIQATDPETDPAAAIGRSSRGAIPRPSGAKYERPDNRIADIEQLAVLAAQYDSLERLIADLLLAGDVYGMDTLDGERAGRDPGPEHDPPGQGAGMVARLRPPPDRGRASRTPGPWTSPAARTRSGGSSTSPSPGRWTSST